MWARHMPFKIGFNGGPIIITDGIDAGVAACAVGHFHMVSQDSIEFRAEPFNGVAALPIKRVRSKFDGHSPQSVKRMCEQQMFCVGIDATALNGFGIPCVADFKPFVCVVNVAKRCHANGFLVAVSDHCERHHHASV